MITTIVTKGTKKELKSNQSNKKHLKVLKKLTLTKLTANGNTCPSKYDYHGNINFREQWCVPSSCHKMLGKVSMFNSFCKYFKLKMVWLLKSAGTFCAPNPLPSALNRVKPYLNCGLTCSFKLITRKVQHLISQTKISCHFEFVKLTFRVFACLSEQNFHRHKLYLPSNLQSTIAANFFELPKNWSYAKDA